MTELSAAEVINAAARQAIVFRQHFPPHHDGSALSFFGGAPIAPRGFRWPRADPSSAPFSFLMQIDCAAVPPAARLGLLPDRGVLYFFLDLTWGEPNRFRVLYEEGGGDDWVPVPPPDDLDVAFGAEAITMWQWTRSVADCPRLLPKWTFDPVAIAIPSEAYARDEDEEEDVDADAPLFWPGKRLEEALRAAQGSEVVYQTLSVGNLIDAQGALLRPSAEYPHDWRAVQICSGLLLEKLSHPHRVSGIAALRDLSDADRQALVTRITDEAQHWFANAASQSPFAAVPEPDRDRFWSWLTGMVWLVRFVIGDALTLSIEASLCEFADAAARIPSGIARCVHGRHALASRSEHGLFVPTPDRMLAPPSDVQGNQWDRAKTHLLLLELRSTEGLGHHFGEGVYQFWVTPGDLAARRFDRVELTADAY